MTFLISLNMKLLYTSALELALTDATNLLSADSLSAGTTMLASLKQTAAAAKLRYDNLFTKLMKS